MEVIVKPGKGRHPDHPSRDPEYGTMRSKGEGRLKRGKLKFSSPAEERDYWKANRANKFNVPGFPNFYPPEHPPLMNGIGNGKSTEILPCGHKWVTMRLLSSGEKRYTCPFGGDFPAEALKEGFVNTVEMTCKHPI